MIKTLFGIWRMRAGGGEKLLAYQLKYIDKSKFDPWLVELSGGKENPFADVYSLPERRHIKFNFKGIKDFISFLKLTRLLKQEKFDAVVTSLFNANLILRAAVWVASLRIPLFNPLPIKGRTIMIIYEHNIYSEKKYWQIKVDQWLSKFTDKIIVDAELVADFTARQESIPRSKFKTLYIPPLMTVSAEPVEKIKQELGIKNNFPVVASIARLVEEKGRIYLVRAAAEVLKQKREVNFILVGDGPKLEELQTEARKLGIVGKVLFPGFYDIAKALKVADIFVDNSLKVDIPIALMEAMRAGKPSVVTRVGEMHKLIKDNQTGFTCEPGDSQGLALAIMKLLASDELATRLGENARREAEKFSIQNYMKDFEQLVLEFYDAKANPAQRR